MYFGLRKEISIRFLEFQSITFSNHGSCSVPVIGNRFVEERDLHKNQGGKTVLEETRWLFAEFFK